MFGLFKRKPPPIVLTPLEQLVHCTDEMNKALKLVQKDEDVKHVRPFVTAYDPKTRKRPMVVLGFWGNGNFNITYDGSNYHG